LNVATTVFTPLEYGSCGLSEEDAIEKFGESNIEVYHTMYQPLEYTVAERDSNGCYAKIICNKNDSERVVGIHILGPNAGEVMQGYAVAIKCGATKAQFDSTIGIHPTVSEVFTTLETTKSSGANVQPTGC
jgi:thioredoxin reductase (NADPH)